MGNWFPQSTGELLNALFRYLASLIWNLITKGTNPPPKSPPQTPRRDYQLDGPDNYQLETKPYGLDLPSYYAPMERLYDDSFKYLKSIYKHDRDYRQVQI